MPKLTWMKKKPEIKYLSALFTAYRQATGITSDQIGAQLGCTGDNVRAMLRRPGKMWRIGELFRFCEILNVPISEAIEAVTKEINQEKK